MFRNLVVAALIVAGNAGATDSTPQYSEELLFPLQEQHVHSSSLAECPNGDFLACWFQGSGERRSPDVVIRGARLKQGKSTWGESFLMADTPGLPDCNPVLFIDPKQELWLFWIAVPAERWEDSLLRFRKAKDYQGKSAPDWYWQDDMILNPSADFPATLAIGLEKARQALPGVDTEFGRTLRRDLTRILDDAQDLGKRQRGWMTRAQVVVLPSGRFLLPLYSDGFLLGLMAISDDGGASWRPSEPIVGAALNQPSIARKQDGTLVAYMREECDIHKLALRSESKDDGETWSVAEYTDIPNPNSSLAVATLRDGRWVMAYNDSQVDRHTLNLALSDDEGATWKWHRHLDDQEGGGFHYPCVLQSRDGLIHVTYTYQPGENTGKSIKHVALDANWIIAGDGAR